MVTPRTIPPGLTFDQWIECFNGNLRWHVANGESIGHALFQTLVDLDADWADRVRGTRVDPSASDGLDDTVAAFVELIFGEEAHKVNFY